MQLVRGINQLPSDTAPSVVTIGNFDGVHLGHQAILQQVREMAARLEQPASVVIFEPQPQEFFRGNAAPARLTPFREKVRHLIAQGAERIICQPFNDYLRSLAAEAFVRQLLVGRLKVQHLVVGDDFRFGCDRAGDFQLLQQMAQTYGFTLERTCTFDYAGERVSSTRIRAALQSGNLQLAARLLGRPYCMTGKVVHGRHLGRQLVPTANLRLGRNRPALQGVYVVMARLPNGLYWPSVANIGLRPTVDGVVPALETHLLGYDGNLYGRRLEICFLAKLRDEQKFAGLDALKAQIQRDTQAALQFFAQQQNDWQAQSAWPSGDIESLLAATPLPAY